MSLHLDTAGDRKFAGAARRAFRSSLAATAPQPLPSPATRKPSEGIRFSTISLNSQLMEVLPHRKMHDCLRIPEIVEEVVSYCAPGTSYHLSVTCRTFYSPATDALWESLESFVPLVKCMPSDLLEEETFFESCDYAILVSVSRPCFVHTADETSVWKRFRRDPTPDEWAMFRKHTARVKAFANAVDENSMYKKSGHDDVNPTIECQLDSETADTIDRYICQLAQGPPASRLFLSLRTLKVTLSMPLYGNSQLVAKHLPLLAGKDLRVLAFDCERRFSEASRVELAPVDEVLPLLSASYPHLQEVDLQNLVGLRGAQDFLFGLTDDVHKLVAYISSEAAERLLLKLSAMPALRELTLKRTPVGPDLYTSTATLAHQCFPALVELTLDRMNLAFTTQALDMLQGSRTLQGFEGCVTTEATVEHLGNVLTSAASLPSLEVFTFHISPYPHTSRPPVLTAAHFRESCKLHRLRRLTVDGVYEVHINDEDLRDLATSCPLLEQLIIGTATRDFDEAAPEPQVTLVGLATLRSACPLIHYIHIGVSSSVLPTAQEHAHPSATQPLVIFIDSISATPDRHSTTVAGVILQLFPNLKKFAGRGEFWFSVKEQVSQHIAPVAAS